MNPRLRSTLVMVAALAFACFLPIAHPALAQDTDMARVRFVNASADATLLDTYINAALAVTSVEGATQYMDVPPGEHTFGFRLPGGTEDLATVTAIVEANQRVSVVALNKQALLEAAAIVDDVSAPVWNGTRIRIVNAVVGGSPVSVNLGDKALATGLGYGQVSDGVILYGGTYDLAVTAEDGAAILSEMGRVISPDRSMTLYVVGDASTGAPHVVTAESTVLNPPATSLFRFAHVAQGVGEVTVYINKEVVPIYQQVRFGGVTSFWAAAPGDYVYDVYAYGTTPSDSEPILSGTATLSANQSILFAAQGTADAPQAGAYLSDLSPVPSGMARLQVINLAVGNSPFTVERIDGPAIFDSIEPLAEGVKIVPGGNYAIRFADATNGETMMEQANISILPGSSTQMIAYDNDPDDPLINAVTVSTDYIQQAPYLRWAHFNAEGPAVDIYMEDTAVSSNLAFKTVSDYKMVQPGVYTFSVYPAGSDKAATEPLWAGEMELGGENFARTMYIYGNAGEAKLAAAPDALDLMPIGAARIRFINAGVGAGVVDVVNPTDNSVAVDNLQPGMSGSNVNIAEGSYSFNFVSDTGVIAKIEGVEMKAGTAYTVVMAGVYGQEMEAIVLEFTP